MEKKTVLLGISGGIAAYKAADLVSTLVKQGINVQAIMTPKAEEFIAPLTIQTLSGNPVWTDEFSLQQNLMVPHVSLAGQAQLFAVVPATANTLAKLAYGLGDNLLTATALVYPGIMLLAPAMNVNMYQHPAVQENLRILKSRGVKVIEPTEGRLACGAVGQGRLAPVEEIAEKIKFYLTEPKDLQGRKVLITAGGTREAIDPVRYIGNRSSGKMGFALAKAAWLRGAEVILISGPSHLGPPLGVVYQQVESCSEMKQAVFKYFSDVDLVIKAAAVADFKPLHQELHKLKKDNEELSLPLQRTPDILSELGEQKTHQVLVGFAAETQELIRHAQEKLNKKNLDLIVANDLTRAGAGFNSDTNIITLLFPEGRMQELPLMSKEDVAHYIIDAITNLPRFKSLPLKSRREGVTF